MVIIIMINNCPKPYSPLTFQTGNTSIIVLTSTYSLSFHSRDKKTTFKIDFLLNRRRRVYNIGGGARFRILGGRGARGWQIPSRHMPSY